MNTIKRSFLLLLSLLILSISIASADSGVDYDAYKEKWDLLYEDEDDWLCVDHAVNYARNNPGWGMVILSPSPALRYQPHMVNYRIEGNILLIHEPQANRTYELEIVNGSMTVPLYEDFPNDFSSQWARPTYFHFIPNESGVRRTYYSLNDNRNEFFDYEIITKYDVTNVTNITNITSEPVNDTALLLSENNTCGLIDNSTVSNDTTKNDQYVEEKDETESFSAKFAELVKSFFGLFS